MKSAVFVRNFAAGNMMDSEQVSFSGHRVLNNMMIKIRFFNDVRKMYSTYFSFIRVSKLFTRSTIVSGAISKQA